MSRLFQCQGPLNGLAVPAGWSGWSVIERAAWVERSGVVGDRVEAYGALLTGGEWPGYVEEGAEYGLGSERGAGERVGSRGDAEIAEEGGKDRGRLEYWWERL